MTLCITLFSTKFPLILPSDPSCSIHVFSKDRLQSLQKNSFLVAKKNPTHFGHHNLIKYKESIVQIWYKDTNSN